MADDILDDKQQRLRDGRSLKFIPPPGGAPESDEERRARTIPAAWLEALAPDPDRVVNHRINIEHAIIDGDLHLSYVTFAGNVRFISCEFTHAVDLSSTVFKRSAVFDDSHFAGPTTFRFAHALYDLNLRGCQFNAAPAPAHEPIAGDNDFKELRVDGVLNASGATFGNVSFDRCQISGSAFFGPRRVAGETVRTIFKGYARFRDAQFSVNAHFPGAEFLGDAEFGRAKICGAAFFGGANRADREIEIADRLLTTTFHGQAVFVEARIEGSLLMSGVQFKQAAIFRALYVGGQTVVNGFRLKTTDGFKIDTPTFGSDANFWRAHFCGNVDFNGAEFRGDAIFVLAQFDSDVKFRPAYLTELPASGLWLTPVRFRNKVDFLDARIGGVAELGGIQCARGIRMNRLKIQGDLNFGYARLNNDPISDCHTVVAGDAGFVDLSVNGLATFEGASFLGEANFNRMHAGTAFLRALRSGTTVVPTKFAGKANFLEMRIDGTLECFGAQFSTANFSRMRVGGDGFWGTVPNGAAPLRTTFSVTARFASARIDGSAHFDGALFGTADSTAAGHRRLVADFGDMRLGGALDCAPFAEGGTLVPCRFEGPVSMTRTIVGADAVFTGCQFEGGVNADALEVDGVVLFREARPGRDQALPVRIGGPASFWGARLKGSADFTGCEFGDTASFMNAVIDIEARFHRARFSGRAVMIGARFQHLRFADATARATSEFENGIDLRGCTYDRIDIDWNSAFRGLEPFDRQPYNQLESCLRSSGKERDAGQVYLLRRRRELAIARDRVFGRGDSRTPQNVGSRLRELPHFFSELLQARLFRFGVRPFRLLGAALVIIVVGAWVFSRPGAVRQKEGGPPRTVRDFVQQPLSRFESLGYSLRMFIPIVELPVGSEWVPSSARCCRGFMTIEAYASLHRLLGAIVTPLGVAALAGVLIRRDKN